MASYVVLNGRLAAPFSLCPLFAEAVDDSDWEDGAGEGGTDTGDTVHRESCDGARDQETPVPRRHHDGKYNGDPGPP